MPFALLIVGSAFLIAGVRGTDDKLLSLLKGDFSGKNNYIAWMLAVLIVGTLGYIEAIKPLSRMFLVLIVVVLILSNRGFFRQFTEQIKPEGSLQTS